MEPTFDAYVAARGEGLVRLALMLTDDPHRAEDLVQSVLTKAYPRWDRIAAMQRPEAYLKRVLVNEHLRWWRRRAASEVPVASPEQTGPPVPAADDALADRDAVWDLLRQLPTRQRAVLALRYYEDLPDGEVADILGCAEGTVRSLASRALSTLRARLPTIDREALP